MRLAVAYGLAWDRFDLAETLKYKVENEGNDNRDFRENYVGPEQMRALDLYLLEGLTFAIHLFIFINCDKVPQAQ